MKLSILPTALREALAVASSAVSTRVTVLPVLGHVLLEADGERLTAAGTDLQTRAWHTVKALVDEAGSVVLPPKPIADFLNAISPDDALTITVNDAHKAELFSGRTRVRLAGIDAEQFPAAPDFSEPSFDTTLAADVLASLIKSVAFAVAPDDSRPVLSGVLLRSDGSTLQLVAADSYRLAMRSVELSSAELNVIAHGKTLAKAGRMLDAATSARLIVDARRSALLVDSEAGCWSVRLLDGEFPDFNRIIPQDAPIAVTVDQADLKRAIGLVRSVEKTTDGFMARFTVEPEALAVRAGGSDNDQEADTVIAATLDRGRPIKIAFNTAYIAAAVEAVESEQITLEIVGKASPAIVRAAGERNGHVQIVMSMYDARGSS